MLALQHLENFAEIRTSQIKSAVRYILLTALIEYMTVLLEYLDLFATVQQALGRARALPGLPLGTIYMPLFETNVSRVSHVLAILVSDYSCFKLVHGL